MPRVAQDRTAAEPSSAGQHARWLRMLEAAAHLAAERGLEGVQMSEVARRAEVAIATLYRYFPSKTHLFVAVLADQVDRLGTRLLAVRRTPSLAADEAVFSVLQQANRALLRRPRLATAMITCVTTADAGAVPGVRRVDAGFHAIVLHAVGTTHPSPDDQARLRLLLQLWYGGLQSCLHGRVSMPDAEADLRLGCRALLAGRFGAAPSDGR